MNITIITNYQASPAMPCTPVPSTPPVPSKFPTSFDTLTKGYDVARMGFSLDLNIPIVFLKYLCESTGYTSTEYKTLIEALETTQENALDGLSYISLDDFIGYVDDLHSLILQEGLVIPLYE